MTSTSRKNILFISFDDCISYPKYRNSFGEALQTPNLDRIADRATFFDSAYCQSPVCGPSRASFMTAKTSHQLGIFDNTIDVFERADPTDIWSYKLKQNGYFCSSGGKIHHGYKPLKRRHHNVIYSDEQKRFTDDFSLPPDVEKRKDRGIRGGWSTTNEADDHIYYDWQVAESAIGFLENYDKDEPFYREVGFFSPHGPRFTPARFKDLYNWKNFQRPEEWDEGFDKHPFSEEHMPQTPDLEKGNENWWRYNVRNYFAGLSHGDYHLGRIWDALQNSRFAKNTIVVIVSDHGFLLGVRNRFYKSTIWEQSAGVPMMIFDPDQDTPQVVDDPVALLDVGPTVLDYAGLDPLADCVGRSLKPQVQGASNPDRVIPTFRFDNVSIRKGHYRLARYMDGTTQLFDLREDIWNYNDLGRDHPEYVPMRDAMIETCADYGLTLGLRDFEPSPAQ
ncbi:sulfatase-like hydrolase/transferase [Shimia sediminis]|uniref:sulfatase-like hydrolase/transferase n=1 Tax=Shimia sediminis TaxID=2497945 RepID=UPI000F8D25CB|nr:sulfatase-like hydrolase/transferase [Shimia sediminis]